MLTLRIEGRIRVLAAGRTEHYDFTKHFVCCRHTFCVRTPGRKRLVLEAIERIFEIGAGSLSEDFCRTAVQTGRTPNPFRGHCRPMAGSEPYCTTDAFLQDLNLILEQIEVAPSRKALYEELKAAADESRRGTGAAFALYGQPGLGKTFLWRLLQCREQRVEDVWIYHKSPQAGITPYAVFTVVTQSLLDTIAQDHGVSRNVTTQVDF